MARFELYLFGHPRLLSNGRPVDISLRKALGLLAYLAVTGQIHSRDALAALFWPEGDQSTARASLRRTLYSLTQAVGEGIVKADAETVALDPQADLWLDVDEFFAFASGCLPAAESPASVDGECKSRLTEAARLCSAEFLAGFSLPDSVAFDEWQFFETERCRQMLAQILVQLITTHQEQVEFGPAIEYARRWLGLDPLHEPAQRLLMQLYAATGQKAAALRQYQQCVRVLRDELGLAPQPETTQLFESIQRGLRLGPPATPAASPTTRYVASASGGRVHLAYQVLGDGPCDLVIISGFVSHLEQMWEEPGLARFFRELAAGARLILFDKRGVGLSDRVGSAPSLEDTVADALTVMDAAGSTRAVVMGASEGGAASAVLAGTHPERVAGLILYGAAAKGTRSADYPWALTREQYDLWLERLMDNWGVALNLEGFAPSRARDERLQAWWAKLLRLASSPGEIRSVLEAMRDVDIRGVLPNITVPTLVMHRSGDRMIRVGGARYIASQVPGSRYVELPGEDHWWWIGDTQPILTEINGFLKGLEGAE